MSPEAISLHEGRNPVKMPALAVMGSLIAASFLISGCAIADWGTDPSKWEKLAPDLILKVAGLALSTFVSIYLAPRLRRMTRAGLRADLEILKLMEELKHPDTEVVRSQVSASIEAIYKKEHPQGRLLPAVNNPREFIMGVIGLPVFSVWTIMLYPNRWLFLTGFLAFASLGWILIGFDAPRSRDSRQKQDASDAQAAPEADPPPS